MRIQRGGFLTAPSLKTNSLKKHNNRQKRGSVREIFGYRFFFSVFLAVFVCVSFAMPSFEAQNYLVDFRLPISGAPLDESAPSPVSASAPAPLRGNLKYGGAQTADSLTGNGRAVHAAASKVNGGAGYVVLDAGNGGADPGSVSADTYEKEITLDVALRTAKILDEAGVSYILTRDDDDYLTIDRRIEYANPEAAAFYVSVHCDWYKYKRVSGTSTLYNVGDTASKDLAGLVNSYLTDGLGTINRGIHPYKNIIILRDARVPAVIVELAFISNKRDLELLNSDEFRERAARNLADGIRAALDKYIKQ